VSSFCPPVLQCIHVHELNHVQALRDLTQWELIFVGVPETTAAHIVTVMADPVATKAHVSVPHIILKLL
jgi:hypothetical protein